METFWRMIGCKNLQWIEWIYGKKKCTFVAIYKYALIIIIYALITPVQLNGKFSNRKKKQPTKLFAFRIKVANVEFSLK